MIAFARIDGAPALNVYAHEAALDHIASSERRLAILQSVSPIQAATSVDGEPAAASMSIVLRNDYGQATAVLASPPLGVVGIVYGLDDPAANPVMLFRGVVDAVSLAEIAQIYLRT